MYKKLSFILFLCLGVQTTMLAQSMTSSPYSGFGLGEIFENIPNTYRGLGGVAIGMRSPKVINSVQPASFTACDSLTFMFDVAASVGWSRYDDAGGMRNRANGAMDYLTVQFPLWKQHIAFSAGVMPFASRGYNFTLSDSIAPAYNYHYTTTYIGSGTISEVYAGLSFNILDWLAIGGNVYYMFTNDYYAGRTLTFTESGTTSVSENSYLSVHSLRFRLGAQFFHTFGDHSFVLGGIYEHKLPLKNEYYVYEVTSEWYAEQDSKALFDLPCHYGVGLSYNWANRLTLAFDFSRQLWSKCRFDDLTGMYRDRNRYAFGLEYRNNPIGRNYGDRMLWRLGGNISNSYVWAIPGREYTAAIGMGFPLRNAGTVFNVSVEYTHRGDKSLMLDNSLKLTLNAAVAENWFFKRRL